MTLNCPYWHASFVDFSRVPDMPTDYVYKPFQPLPVRSLGLAQANASTRRLHHAFPPRSPHCRQGYFHTTTVLALRPVQPLRGGVALQANRFGVNRCLKGRRYRVGNSPRHRLAGLLSQASRPLAQNPAAPYLLFGSGRPIAFVYRDALVQLLAHTIQANALHSGAPRFHLHSV